MPLLGGYAYSQKVSITGNKPSAATNNDTMLVKYTASTELNDYTQNAGLDIAFTLEGDDTELPYERVEWIDNGADVDAVFYVKCGVIGFVADTDLRIYIGKAGGTAYAPASDTWTGYTAVWHLNNSLLDSGANGWTLTNNGGAGSATGGKIAGYYELSTAASDSMLTNNAADPNGYPTSMMCWFKTDSIVSTGTLGFHGTSGVTNNYHYMTCQGTVGGDPVRVGSLAPANVGVDTTTGFSANTWHMAAALWSGATDRRVFIDGGSKGTSVVDTGSPASTFNRIAIGASMDSTPFYTSGAHHTKQIEEFRIAGGAFGQYFQHDSIVKFIYDNMADYSNTITHGAWELAGAAQPDVDGDANPTGDAFPDTCEDEFTNVLLIPEAEFTLVDNCDLLEPPDPIFEASGIYGGYGFGGHSTPTTAAAGLLPVNLYFATIGTAWTLNGVQILRFNGTPVPYSSPLPKSKVVFATACLYDINAEGTGNGSGIHPGDILTIQLKKVTFADVSADADADAWANLGNSFTLTNLQNVSQNDWRPAEPAVANRDIDAGDMIGGHCIPTGTWYAGAYPGNPGTYPSHSSTWYLIVTAYLETTLG